MSKEITGDNKKDNKECNISQEYINKDVNYTSEERLQQKMNFLYNSVESGWNIRKLKSGEYEVSKSKEKASKSEYDTDCKTFIETMLKNPTCHNEDDNLYHKKNITKNMNKIF